MKAVVLAAGKGTRMRPLTEDTPKPLLPVAGKPIMEHNIEVLEESVDEVVIVAGYRKDEIEQHFDREDFTVVEQEEALGTAHAALQAKDHVDGKTVILNGDDLYDPGSMEKALEKDSAVLADRVEDASEYGVFELEDGNVSGIQEKPEEPPSRLVNIGFYVVQESFFEMLEDVEKSERGEYEITDALRQYLEDGEVELVEADRWIPCSYPEDLVEANRTLLEGHGNAVSEDAEVHETASVENSIIMEGARIGRDAEIYSSVIHEDGEVGDASRIENVVLRDSSTVEEGVKAEDVHVRPESTLDSTPEGYAWPG